MNVLCVLQARGPTPWQWIPWQPDPTWLASPTHPAPSPTPSWVSHRTSTRCCATPSSVSRRQPPHHQNKGATAVLALALTPRVPHRCSVPTGPTRRNSTTHVSGPPAAGHACTVSRAAAAGDGAAVAAWTPHAWRTSARPGGLLQVRHRSTSTWRTTAPRLTLLLFVLQPSEEGKRQAAVTSSCSAGRRKLLRIGVCRGSSRTSDQSQFEVQKNWTELEMLRLLFFFLSVPVKDFF